PGDGELLLRAGFGWKSDLIGSNLTTAAPNSFAGFTLNSPTPVVIGDFAEEDRFEVPDYLKEHNCRSGVSVSIAGRDGRAYGILGIYTPNKRLFRPQDISFLAAVRNLLPGALRLRHVQQRHEYSVRAIRTHSV